MLRNLRKRYFLFGNPDDLRQFVVEFKNMKLYMKFLYTLILIFLTLAGNINAQWSKVNSLSQNSLNDLFIEGNNFYVSSTQGGFYRSTDAGAAWTAINTNLTGDALRAYQIVKIETNLWAATVDGVYKSTNNGDTWVKKSNGMVIGGGANNLFAFSVYLNNGNLYSGTHAGLYRSTDGGENWVITNVNIQHTNIHSFAFHNNILFAGRDAINTPILYKSTDNGLSWTTISIWNNFPLGVICFWNEPGKLFAGTGHGMWLSTNNGANWETRSDGLGSDPYVSSLVKTGSTMIGTLKFGGSGVYKTTNDGVNWTDITDNLPFLSTIDRILIHDNTVYIATSNGVWKRPLSDIVTGVTISGSTIPREYKLEQNYPNPFNPATNFEFRIADFGFVTLKVYDMQGKEIRTIVSENLKAGVYKASFDGSRLSSGVYYYELTAGNFKETRKMLLVK
jgi:photosystem II stability/assembly factor-like uncharacterized protein